MSDPPTGTEPLVSIGLPTYNRVGTLGRAIESALAQTHTSLEIIVSDNASDDGTEGLCRHYADRDARIRYVRQPQNRGPTANFNFLFATCRGEFVQMLADDDWLDPDYIHTCLAELQARPDHVLVAGTALYYRDGRQVAEGVPVQIPEADPAARVRSYYRQVDDNGTFYGLIRRSALQAAGPMGNDLGNDWFHLAAIAVQGKVLTLPAPHVHRDAEGTSESVAGILTTFGESRRVEARLPHLFMAARAWLDIAWKRPIYRSVGLGRRFALAFAVMPSIVNWRSLAWHLVAPTMARVRSRPGGRFLWRAFMRLARALGAGRTRLG